MVDPQPGLSIQVAQGPDACLVLVRGELHPEGCQELDRALEEAERTEAGRIILDLEELTFIDSTGLKTLLETSRRSASNGNRLRVSRGKDHPAEMFRLTMLDLTLPFIGPVGERPLGAPTREMAYS